MQVMLGQKIALQNSNAESATGFVNIEDADAYRNAVAREYQEWADEFLTAAQIWNALKVGQDWHDIAENFMVYYTQYGSYSPNITIADDGTIQTSGPPFPDVAAWQARKR